MLCLDKIYEQKEFFKDLMEDKKSIAEACKKPYLKIKCKDEKKYVCPTKKKKTFPEHFHKKSFSKTHLWYFKKKDVSRYRKLVFGSLVFHQLTVPKLPSAFQMPTISGLLYLLVLKSPLHYFKKP